MFCHQWQLGSYTSDLRQHIISVLYFYQAGLGGKQRPSGVTYSTHIDYQRRTSLPLCAVILSYIHKHCQTILRPCHGRWMFKSDPARWGINSYVELIPKKHIDTVTYQCHQKNWCCIWRSFLYPLLIRFSVSLTGIYCWLTDHIRNREPSMICDYIHVLCFNSRDPDTFPSSF